MEIDDLTVEGPVRIPPALSPVQNTVYRAPSPRDVSMKLDRNGHPLLSVTRDGREVPYRTEEVWYTEDSSQVILPAHALSLLQLGVHRFLFNLQGTGPLAFDLEVRDAQRASEWIVVCLDVRHGVSVLMLLPTGKALLIDTGTEAVCKERVLAFPDRHAITQQEVHRRPAPV